MKYVMLRMLQEDILLKNEFVSEFVTYSNGKIIWERKHCFTNRKSHYHFTTWQSFISTEMIL